MIGRRGKPNHIISDNFKSFKASTLKRFHAHQGIKWSFILERFPCWEGFYERLVAIVKNSLKKGVLTSKLSLDELQTVIIEIENVINSRPLTHLEDQPYESLTPYHLIYGRNLACKRTDKEIKEFSSDEYIKSCKKLKANISYFKYRFKNEYLTALQERRTYLNKCKNNAVEEILRIGDVVILKEENKPRLTWRKGKSRRLSSERTMLPEVLKSWYIKISFRKL